MQSRWNGITVLNLYVSRNVGFRMARITDRECSASEYSLIFRLEGGMVVPMVKLAHGSVSFSFWIVFVK